MDDAGAAAAEAFQDGAAAYPAQAAVDRRHAVPGPGRCSVAGRPRRVRTVEAGPTTRSTSDSGAAPGNECSPGSSPRPRQRTPSRGTRASAPRPAALTSMRLVLTNRATYSRNRRAAFSPNCTITGREGHERKLHHQAPPGRRAAPGGHVDRGHGRTRKDSPQYEPVPAEVCAPRIGKGARLRPNRVRADKPLSVVVTAGQRGDSRSSSRSWKRSGWRGDLTVDRQHKMLTARDVDVIRTACRPVHDEVVRSRPRWRGTRRRHAVYEGPPGEPAVLPPQRSTSASGPATPPGHANYRVEIRNLRRSKGTPSGAPSAMPTPVAADLPITGSKTRAVRVPGGGSPDRAGRVGPQVFFSPSFSTYS